MKQKVIVYERVEQEVLNELKQRFDVTYFKKSETDTKNDPEFLAALEVVDGIIGLELEVDQQLIDRAPNLKIVSNVSVGYNNLDVNALTKRGIMATNTPGVLTDTVADAIFGILIATARRIPELDHYVKSGQWDAYLTNEHFGTNVHHKKLGIIGMGAIGQAIAQRAYHGFDMEIFYHNRSRNKEAEQKYHATYMAMDDLLQQSDFVLLMTPLTPETEGMIGIDEFKQMKQSAIFINGSRGKTIVEKDLVKALQNKEILAAGLDVFEQEPVDPNNPLLKMPNVVTLPHIGSSTHETELAMSKLAAKNLIAGLSGNKPPTLINETVWEQRKN